MSQASAVGGRDGAVDQVAGAVAEIAGRTPWQITRARLAKDKVTMVAMGAALFFIVLALLAPVLTHFGLLDPYSNHTDLVGGLGSLPKGPLGGVSPEHWMGVEPGTGRDIFSRVVSGLTVSLIVATLAVTVSVILGTVIGIVSGTAGGRVDWLFSRITDFVLSFPQTLMLIALSTIVIDMLQSALNMERTVPSMIFMILVMGFFGWPIFARVIRGQVLSLKQREFIEAAHSLGAGRARIYFKELLPHLWAPILVYTTLVMPQNIATEAALGFLGVGIQAPTPSFGSILNDSVHYATSDPAYFIFPGVTLFLVVLSFNLLGDGLRDALDPKADRQ
ncbi:MAG TPA: ABC transporter permease [Propionicimonas sp.]|nr:ABC transporter permease [Propionicimonas sp.]HQA77501.1 ABC transporter permease [Propionicimonas sp.]HQD97320.1 ABC transporter permease [Propionicimonas sp.]